MQQVLLTDALNPETPPRERAQVACAWERLEERKRILRMRPKPKDVDVSAKRRVVSAPQVHLWDAPDEGGAAESKTPNGS